MIQVNLAALIQFDDSMFSQKDFGRFIILYWNVYMINLFLIQLDWEIFVSKHFEIDLDDIYFETSRNGFYGIELILINSFCQKQPP